MYIKAEYFLYKACMEELSPHYYKLKGSNRKHLLRPRIINFNTAE